MIKVACILPSKKGFHSRNFQEIKLPGVQEKTVNLPHVHTDHQIWTPGN